MKFYDLEGLARSCGKENKYELTARISARARWLSDRKAVTHPLMTTERYLSIALLEVKHGNGIPEPGAPCELPDDILAD